jgi:CRP-like cAMP-binding protein
MGVRRDAPGWDVALARLSAGKTTLEYGEGDVIFVQGGPADSVYFLLRGAVRLSVTTPDGKEAIVATLSDGDLFGEGCLADQSSRTATAIASQACTVARVDKPAVARLLHEDSAVAELILSHLLRRLTRYEADLVDQLFHSCEKRLARVLLLLSHHGKDPRETLVAGVTQEQLAQMVGTTRSRINLFMTRFRKRGFIDYHGEAGVTVHPSLLSVLADDPDHIAP